VSGGGNIGAEHPGTGASLHNLALLLQAQGDLPAARPLAERALAIREKELGPEHRDTSSSLNNLALLLQAQGDLAAARPLTTSTFEIMKSSSSIGRAEALRRAMLAYMNDASASFNAYPAFWGAFSVIGEGAAR
jgi:Flp pilus assembly protein TadD